jgi:hypothetical protein
MKASSTSVVSRSDSTRPPQCDSSFMLNVLVSHCFLRPPRQQAVAEVVQAENKFATVKVIKVLPDEDCIDRVGPDEV